MEAFYKIHEYLLTHTEATVRRELMDEIDWNDRLIGIKGTRGVGKTTFLIQYAQERFRNDRSCLYVRKHITIYQEMVALNIMHQGTPLNELQKKEENMV